MSQDGAKSQPKTKIPTLSHIIKPQFESATSRASSLNPGPGTPSLRKKRTHSDTGLSPTENLPKQSKKMDEEQLDLVLDKYFKAHREETREENVKNRAEMSKLSDQVLKTEQNIGDKFDKISGQISVLRDQQDQDTAARQKLQATVSTLEGKVSDMNDRIDTATVPDTQAIVDSLLPLVTEALSAR